MQHCLLYLWFFHGVILYMSFLRLLKTKDKFDNYFLDITKEDIKQHKALLRIIKQDTANMIRSEAKKIQRVYLLISNK